MPGLYNKDNVAGIPGMLVSGAAVAGATLTALEHTKKTAYNYADRVCNLLELDCAGMGTSKSRKHALNITPATAGKSKKKPRLGSCPAPKLNSKVSNDHVVGERPMIDSDLVPSLHTNRLTGIVLRTGPRLKSTDPITPFLKNLMQSGTTTAQWGGFMDTDEGDVSESGLRSYICTNFRHRWSQNAGISPDYATNDNPNQGVYPDVTGCHVMLPENDVNVGQLGSMTGPYWVHSQGEDCYAPYNRGDLEDMSWNLNKLKLAPNKQSMQTNATNVGQSVGSQEVMNVAGNSSVNPMFQPNVSSSATDGYERHYRVSTMQTNNEAAANYTSASWVDAPYKFNMVFKGGNVNYQFHNVRPNGCRIEVVLYRMKKGTQQSDTIDDYGPDGRTKVNGSPLENILPPIQQGYVDTVVGKRGTESFGGRNPNLLDVVDNPDYPFLPELKKTKKQAARFKEVTRSAFCLPAGGRRSVDIALEGVIYDPANVKKYPSQGTVTSGEPALNAANVGAGIIDEYTYCVVIALCGVKMARVVEGGPFQITDSGTTTAYRPESQVIGDVHCPAAIQYLCTYREDIQACHYKNPGSKAIYNNCLAASVDFDTDASGHNAANAIVSAKIIIPQDKTVRMADTTVAELSLAGKTTSYSNSNARAFTSGMTN